MASGSLAASSASPSLTRGAYYSAVRTAEEREGRRLPQAHARVLRGPERLHSPRDGLLPDTAENETQDAVFGHTARRAALPDPGDSRFLGAPLPVGAVRGQCTSHGRAKDPAGSGARRRSRRPHLDPGACAPPAEEARMEPGGFEPPTFWLPARRSPN